MENRESPLQQLDYTLLFIIFLLMCVSLLALSSAPTNFEINFAVRQFVWYIVGAVAVFLIMMIDYDRLQALAWPLYALGCFLLSGLLLGKFGVLPSCSSGCLIISDNGATSWYSVPIVGTFQPGEFVKIFLVITISHLIVKHHEMYPEKTTKTDLRLFAKIVLTAALPLMLVALQPDLGTALVLTAITLSLLLVSGIRWQLLTLVVLSGIASLATVILLYLKYENFWLFEQFFGHVESRFYGWLMYEKYRNAQGFQLFKSLNAIGSGGLYGKGYGEGVVEIPEAYTDFIFAVIAEEFGFLGASIVISLFFLLVYRIIYTALETHDPFGSYLCAGIIGMLTFQVFQNIGMTIQVLPITGIPLPFISYGGTSLLTYMMAIGIVLNIRTRTRTYMFD